MQWLEFDVFTAMAPSSIPGQGTKILQTAECSQKKARNTLLFMESQKKIQFVDLHRSSSNIQSKKISVEMKQTFHLISTWSTTQIHSKNL